MFDELTNEQKMAKESIRHFLNKEMEPIAGELYETGRFPYEIIKKMGELGFLGIFFPEKYGGSGGDFLSYIVEMEEIGRIDVGLAATVHVHVTMGCNYMYLYGSEEQKKKYLSPAARGELTCAFGLTEPEAGSDAAATRTKAVLNGDEWVINGSKCFITNAGTEITKGVVVQTVTREKKDGRNELSNIFIPNGIPGYKIGTNAKKIGAHNMDNRELFFDDCRVPAENLIGERGKGFSQFMHCLDYGRISIAAICVGVLQRSLEEALKYSKMRKQFNRPIFDFQLIQQKIADIAVDLELSRLITHKAAALADAGKSFTKEAAYAKLFCSETAVKATGEVLQIFGGNGFMEEYPIGRLWRDIKLLTIGEGTSEIMRLIIAKSL